jgi:hypothetical protein
MAARGGELLLTSRMRLFRVILVVAVLASAVLAGIARSGQVEAAGWLGQWSKRTAITLDHSRFDADLSGFPVLVKFGTSAGRDSQDVSFVFDELVSDVNRFKIAVTSADGVSQCYVEIVRWSQAEETAFLYVKVPMVSYAADTVLFLYYDVTKPDNTTFVGDVGSVAGRVVWANGFSHIYHLTEQGNGTAGEFKDSKGTVDGTASKGIDPRWTGTHYPTRVNSPVGFGQNFGGNLDPNVITIPDNDDFSVVSAREITISFWFNPDTLTFGPPKDYPFSWGGFVDIMGKGQNDGNLEWDFNFYSNNAPVASYAYNWTTFYMYSLTTNYGNGCATENPPGSAVVTSAGAWYYVTATMKASPSWFSEQVKGAVNSGNAYDFSGPPYYVVPGNGTAPVNIGTRQGHLLFDGSIAGLRFSNVIRSSAWRDASYYSDKDALLTFGSPVTMVPPTTSVPAVATVAASGITTNSSTLNGTLDSMGSAASVAVSFEYGLTTGYGTVVPAVPSSLSAAGSFSAIVSSLSPGTLYHYRARAVGDGTAFGSDRTTTTTATPAPVPPPAVVSVPPPAVVSAPPPAVVTMRINTTGFMGTDLTVDADGKVQEDARLVAEDGNVLLRIDKGARLSDKTGAVPTGIAVARLLAPKGVPPNRTVLLAYRFAPETIAFDPPINMTVSYNLKTLPAKALEDNLSVSYWDGSQWVALETSADPLSKTLSVRLARLGDYALFTYNLSSMSWAEPGVPRATLSADEAAFFGNVGSTGTGLPSEAGSKAPDGGSSASAITKDAIMDATDAATRAEPESLASRPSIVRLEPNVDEDLSHPTPPSPTEPTLVHLDITPNRQSKTGLLVSARINCSLENPSPMTSNTIVLKVSLDGELLEDVVLSEGRTELSGDSIEYEYIPSWGWKSGTYTFDIVLAGTDRLVTGNLEQTLVYIYRGKSPEWQTMLSSIFGGSPFLRMYVSTLLMGGTWVFLSGRISRIPPGGQRGRVTRPQ